MDHTPANMPTKQLQKYELGPSFIREIIPDRFSCEFNTCESGMRDVTETRRWTWGCHLCGFFLLVPWETSFMCSPFMCHRMTQVGSMWVTSLIHRALSHVYHRTTLDAGDVLFKHMHWRMRNCNTNATSHVTMCCRWKSQRQMSVVWNINTTMLQSIIADR
jgi:hypothetical protein